MQTLLPYLAVLVVILTGWGIAKKLQVTTLLLFAGLALNLLAVLAGIDNILPRGAKTTGWIGFDLFEALRALSRSQIASTGFIILVAGGFAAYMDKIGATNKLVALCTKPLSKLSAPYVILGAVFLLGHFLGLVVTSAAGLGTLLAVSVFPLLLGVGVSAVAASAAIASALVFSYAPSSAIAVLAAKTAGAEPMDYLMNYQLPVAVPAVLTVLVLHILVQRYLDKKDMAEGKIEPFDLAEIEAKKTSAADTPCCLWCRSCFFLSSTRWSIRRSCLTSARPCLSDGCSRFSSISRRVATLRRFSRTVMRCSKAWAIC